MYVKQSFLITCFMIFCYVGYFSQFSIMSQYIYSRVQKQYNISLKNYSACSEVENKNLTDDYNKIQKENADINIYSQCSGGIPSLFTVLFIGVISDIYGRKSVLIFSWLCLALSNGVNILITAFEWPIWSYYIGQFIGGLGGSYGAIISLVLSLISDFTKKNERNIGVVAIEFSLGLSMIISQLTIGIWIKGTHDYFWPTITFSYIQLFSIVFLIFIQEKENTNTKKKFDKYITISKLKNIFLLKQNVHWLLLICLTVFFIHTFNFLGNLTILTVFLFGKPFCWEPDTLGYYRSLSHGIILIGIFIYMGLLKFKLNEVFLVNLGFVTIIVSKVLLAIAPEYSSTTAKKIVFASLLDLFSGGSISLLRSMNSKLVMPNNYGTLFGLMSCLETLSGLIGGVVYNGIYEASFHFLYGFIYIFAAIFLSIAFCLMILYYYLDKKSNFRLYESFQEVI